VIWAGCCPKRAGKADDKKDDKKYNLAFLERTPPSAISENSADPVAA
jgi:hypothetical protein